MSNSTDATRTEKNRDKWRVLIAEWENSGLSQVAFCQKNNLNKAQFLYYRQVLASPKIAKLLPIRVVADEKPTPLTQSLTLYLSDTVKLEIPLTGDFQVLQTLFAAARGTGC